MRLPLIVLSLFLSQLLQAKADDFDLYFLGGQSNMDGYGKNKELPAELNSTQNGVYIFHGNTAADSTPADGRGLWSELAPGHGAGFQSDGARNKPSDRFGVELTFAQHLVQTDPNRRVAIIKYSRGGTSIAEQAAGQFGSWEPDFQSGQGTGKGVNQYDHFLATVRNAMQVKDIDGDGTDDTLFPVGIVWMQGESDAAYGAEIAEQYESNLKRLIDLIRAALLSDDLPVVIGRISDSGNDEQDGKVWDHGEVVRRAQAAFVEKDAAAALVTTTDGYGYSDPWHYDSAGYLDLGHQFSAALIALRSAELK